mgnify:CR=1 FL=1
MPSFSTEVDHSLGREQATQRLKDFVEKVSEHYKDQVNHMEGQWDDNVLQFALTTYGFHISGTLTVDDDKARLYASLPFAALAFRGKIEQSIASEIRRELS